MILLKIFKLADPIHNADLFDLAEQEISKMKKNNSHLGKYRTLMKLYDQADVINDIV